MFTIDYDEARGFVRVTGTGSWNPVALARFALETRRVEIALIGRRDIRILGDARRMTVQSQPVTHLCRAIVGRLLDKPGMRVAVLTETTLTRMQLERTFQGMAVGIFATEAEAFAYLDRADRPIAAIA